MCINIYQYGSICINMYQYVSMCINMYQCVSISSSSSSWSISVYQRRAHSRAVVFKTLQIETRLCPLLAKFVTLYPLLLSQLLKSSVLTPPPFIPPGCPCPSLPPPLPPPSPLPLTGQLLPVITTAFPPFPPASSPPPWIGPESAALQCTAWPCSAFAECRFLSSQIQPPLFLPLLRCTPTFRPSSAMEAVPLVHAPPGPGNLLGTAPRRG